MTLRRLAFAHRIIALTCLTVMAGSCLLGASIICIGAEGHVSLENPQDDCCDSERASCSPERASSSTVALDVERESEEALLQDGSCGDCVDYGLQVRAVLTRECSSAQLMPPPFTVAVLDATAADASRCCGATHGVGRSRAPRACVALTRLQGVLLRC